MQTHTQRHTNTQHTYLIQQLFRRWEEVQPKHLKTAWADTHKIPAPFRISFAFLPILPLIHLVLSLWSKCGVSKVMWVWPDCFTSLTEEFKPCGAQALGCMLLTHGLQAALSHFVSYVCFDAPVWAVSRIDSASSNVLCQYWSAGAIDFIFNFSVWYCRGVDSLSKHKCTRKTGTKNLSASLYLSLTSCPPLSSLMWVDG